MPRKKTGTEEEMEEPEYLGPIVDEPAPKPKATTTVKKEDLKAVFEQRPTILGNETPGDLEEKRRQLVKFYEQLRALTQ